MDLQKYLQYVPQLVIFISIIGIIYFAHKSKEHSFSVFDYLLDPATGKASITKTLQVVAGITATWVIVRMAVKDTLTVDMFLIYLGAMGISEAWSKFVGAKWLGKFTSDKSDTTKQE